VNELSIYISESSSIFFKHHLNQCVGEIAAHWFYFNNISDFIKSAQGRRIACFHIPMPYSDTIEHEIDQIYDSVDLILILGSELHPKHVDFIRRFDREKIRYFLCGYVINPLMHARDYRFLDWFISTVHFYKDKKPSILYQLNPYNTKPLMFDALLGRGKPHRDLAYNFIQEHDLASKGVVTYMGTNEMQFQNSDSNRWQWQADGIEDFESAKTLTWTVDRVKYHGHNMSISQIIPIDIYNRTAYSLICETNSANDFIFYTEKTVKPILARRLFIIIGNRYSLEGLRRLGFKTFGGIIDESYDSLEYINERHLAAMEQLQWLCNQDQTTILNKCKDIVDHNYDLMYGRDWYGLFKNIFRDQLIGKI